VSEKTQSPYLRAEVNRLTMDEYDKEELLEVAYSSSRGENVGKAFLADNEYICPENDDYINTNMMSVLMHARSQHETEGEEHQLVEDIEAVSSYYRSNPLLNEEALNDEIEFEIIGGEDDVDSEQSSDSDEPDGGLLDQIIANMKSILNP